MKEHQQKVAAILRQDPNVDSFMSGVGPVGTIVAVQYGPRLHPFETEVGASFECGRGHPGTPAKTGDRSRNSGLPAEPSADPYRRNTNQEPVSVYPAEPEHEGTV